MKRRKMIYDGDGHYLDVKYNPDDSSLLDKVKAYVIKDCFDEQDVHYFRKPKSLKKGTEIIISSIVENLYGTYFRTYVNNIRFDIDPSFVSFVKPSWYKDNTQQITDEEKALELSSINKYGFSVEESNAAYNAALEMARWKEQQMIEKSVEWLNAHLPFGEVDFNLRNTIIEDFEQSMKED